MHPSRAHNQAQPEASPMHSHGVVLLLWMFWKADLLDCVLSAAREVTEDGLVTWAPSTWAYFYLYTREDPER